MDHLIISVGTSVIHNAAVLLSSNKKLSKKAKMFSSLLQDHGKRRDSDKTFLSFVDDFFRSIVDDDDLDELVGHLVSELSELMISEGPGDLSAELNTMACLNPDPDYSKVTLIATDTPTGKISAMAIHKILSSVNFACNLVFIEGFSPDNLINFENGLIEYSNALISIITSALVENEKVKLLVTGGFKAQVVYSALIAMLFGVPSVYMHESFSNAFILPPLPLKLDKQFWSLHRSHLEWFRTPRSVEEIRAKMSSIPESLSFFVRENEDGKKELSAFGRIVLNLYESSSSFFT
ncbi:MAG: putative CRISPR-associated protein [Candidatus Helarchaeales archaeon]